MSDPYIGQIMTIAFDFAPFGFAFCDGAILYIHQNDALYSVIGNRFGGNGVYSFCLPNLQGRIPIGLGQGPGLTERQWGVPGGAETMALTENQVMAHTHQAVANDAANQVNPTGMIWSGDTTGTNPYYSDTKLAQSYPLAHMAISSAGGGGKGLAEPHNNLPPVLKLSYVIALEGWYPSRD